MKITSLVIASCNPGKVREFRTLLSATGWEVLGLADLAIEHECEETGQSFAENARLKALEYSMLTDLPVLADDSGLEVDALGGRPGVYSARYAGPESSDANRVAKLLDELEKAGGSRAARFVCALAMARQGTVIEESEGTCRGLITTEPRGTKGFGYDPVFLLPELGRTYAELSEAEKNRHSHRARALQSLLKKL
jgi:XTP/dITP diphosphohydrolase